MAGGTSSPVEITGGNLSLRKNPTFSPVEGISTTAYGKNVKVIPPEVTTSNLSEAVYNHINCFPAFTFEKISIPEYGASNDSIARFTGIPVNNPDYTNDYFFIGIMRMVDKITNPSYRGKVINIYNTPGPKS